MTEDKSKSDEARRFELYRNKVMDVFEIFERSRGSYHRNDRSAYVDTIAQEMVKAFEADKMSTPDKTNEYIRCDECGWYGPATYPHKCHKDKHPTRGEIYDAADNIYSGVHNVYQPAFIHGCTWYREFMKGKE